MNIEHWMHFGTFAEKDYFLYPNSDSYTGVIFNANMVTFAPDALGAFTLEKIKSVKYIINPLTHAFQHDVSMIKNDKNVIKDSIQSLIRQYGSPVLELAGKRPLLPEDLPSPVLQEFVKNCIDFQKNYLSKSIFESNANK